MAQESLFGEELKTRISKELKGRIVAEASRRQVKSATLVREALASFLDKNSPPRKHRRAA